MVEAHGSGFIMSGDNLNTKIDHALHHLMRMAKGKNMDGFADKIDFDQKPIKIE